VANGDTKKKVQPQSIKVAYIAHTEACATLVWAIMYNLGEPSYHIAWLD